MKTMTISFLSLLVGIGLGWYIGYTSSNSRAARREVRHDLDIYEKDGAVAAVFAVQAVSCIDSGETQRAVQILSRPIANFYCDYVTLRDTNSQKEQFKLYDFVQKLAITNQVVATQISNDMVFVHLGEQ